MIGRLGFVVNSLGVGGTLVLRRICSSLAGICSSQYSEFSSKFKKIICSSAGSAVMVVRVVGIPHTTFMSSNICRCNAKTSSSEDSTATIVCLLLFRPLKRDKRPKRTVRTSACERIAPKCLLSSGNLPPVLRPISSLISSTSFRIEDTGVLPSCNTISINCPKVASRR